jgi:preprotein translocase subunit SecF
MIFGIVFGTYSSIFIATPPLLYLHLRRGAAAEEKALAETP